MRQSILLASSSAHRKIASGAAHRLRTVTPAEPPPPAPPTSPNTGPPEPDQSSDRGARLFSHAARCKGPDSAATAFAVRIANTLDSFQALPRASVLTASPVFGSGPATEYWSTVRQTFRLPNMSMSQTERSEYLW